MNITKTLVLTVTLTIIAGFAAIAGNKDRVGQAGAYELLVNPWAKSNGLNSANIANTRGIESTYLNVAGLAFTNKTQVIFTQTQYLRGSGVNINALGLAQRIGDASVIAMNVVAMGFGEELVTTENQPEGGIGTYQPSYMNIGLSYAREFSSSIYGGVNVKIINESISDLSATGVAIDAGIQYVSDRLRFGITLKNIGTPMSFNGDGISVRGLVNGSATNMTLEMRSGEFELPSMLAMGGTYNFLWGKKEKNVSSMDTGGSAAYDDELTYDNAEHILSISAAFVANSFSKDQFLLGVEYGYHQMLFARAGYYYEKGMLGDGERTTAFTGPSAGMSVKIPLNKKTGTTVSIDYAYRFSNPWFGSHSMGLLLDL